MSEAGLFPRLLELILTQKNDDPESAGTGLHRILMDLMYEMARIQRLRVEDLGEFIEREDNNNNNNNNTWAKRVVPPFPAPESLRLPSRAKGQSRNLNKGQRILRLIRLTFTLRC